MGYSEETRTVRGKSENWSAARTDFKSLMQEQHSDHKLYRIK